MTFKCERCMKCCVESVIFIFAKDWETLKTKYPVECENAEKKATWHENFFLSFDHGCGFLGDGACLIYADRPSTCRSFPLLLDRTFKLIFSCPAIHTIDQSDVVVWKKEINKHISMILKYMKFLDNKYPNFKHVLHRFERWVTNEQSDTCMWYPVDEFLDATREMKMDEKKRFVADEKEINKIVTNERKDIMQRQMEVYEKFKSLSDVHKKFTLNKIMKMQNERAN